MSTFENCKSNADIVFAGDSITMFGIWDEYFPEFKVLNRGIGSDTVEGLYNRIDDVVSHDPEIIVIMIGINDLGVGIKAEDSTLYMDKILDKVTVSCSNCRIILVSVLPSTKVEIKDIKELNCDFKQLVINYENCEFMDLFSDFLDENGNQNMQLYSSDGTHLNGSGYNIWVEKLKKVL